MGEDAVDDGVLFGREAEFRAREVEGALIQHADHEFFAVDGGQRGDAEVVIGAVDGHADAAVLRDAAFGYGDSRKNFQTGADGRVTFDGEFRTHLQIAVDTVADFDGLFKGFDVDIAGAEGNRLFDDGIDQAHGGIVDDVVVAVDEVDGRVAHRRVYQFFVLGALQVFERVRGRLHRHDRIDKNIDLHGGHEDEIGAADIDLADHRHGRHIQRPRDRHQQHAAAVYRYRHEFVLAQKGERNVF